MLPSTTPLTIAYQLLNTNILSTSTLASPAIVLGGFGPVAREGYGIGYGMDENNLLFNVTSYLNVSPFLEKLDESLKDMVKGEDWLLFFFPPSVFLPSSFLLFSSFAVLAAVPPPAPKK